MIKPVKELVSKSIECDHEKIIYELYKVANDVSTGKLEYRVGKSKTDETFITSTVSENLKSKVSFRKALFQDEVHFFDICDHDDPDTQDKRVDLSCFYLGGFHFLEYKHLDNDNSDTSNIAALRQCINDLNKLYFLKRFKDNPNVDLSRQKYSFCIMIYNQSLDEKDLEGYDFEVEDKLINFWLENPDQNNNDTSLKLPSKSHGIYALCKMINEKKGKYSEFNANIYKSKENMFFVISTIE